MAEESGRQGPKSLWEQAPAWHLSLGWGEVVPVPLMNPLSRESGLREAPLGHAASQTHLSTPSVQEGI